MYLRLFCFSVFICFLISCTQNRVSRIYIIPKEDSIIKKKYTREDGIVIMPPKIKYSRYTFVIDSINNLYFYSFQEPLYKDGVYDEDEPDSIFLSPNVLVVIPSGTEELFFEQNVLKQKSNEKFRNIGVSSFGDTLKGTFINYLLSAQKDTMSHINLNIRLSLPEERKAVKYKLLGIHYKIN